MPSDTDATKDRTRPVRVRIAPSPTGYFHVGGARTALYNWCFACRRDGVFILRIEDTDSERNKEEWVAGIGSALAWLGIDWDEGPYRQSERKAHYQEALDDLWENGHLYACDCTRELVLERTKANATPGYDGFCRDRGLDRGLGRALRFKVPPEGVTVVEDLVRGEVRFANSTIEDFVVAKSNGDPLFVLAGVVDDREMRISHVIRAEEHLPTTPKAVLIWEALGTGELPLPAYAHLPVLVNEKRQKISKRRDRVAIEDYRAQGFLPEAMVNYLALLGWSPGDGREFFTLTELVSEFDLANVNHSPAFFDQQKLLHFNGVYLRALPLDEFVDRAGDGRERTPSRPSWWISPRRSSPGSLRSYRSGRPLLRRPRASSSSCSHASSLLRTRRSRRRSSRIPRGGRSWSRPGSAWRAATSGPSRSELR